MRIGMKPTLAVPVVVLTSWACASSGAGHLLKPADIQASEIEVVESEQAEEWPASSTITDYDAPPRIVKQTKPEYPENAFRRKLQGVVYVEFVIESDGIVRQARVYEPEDKRERSKATNARELQRAALDTVRQWRFEPARKDGQPVATIARAPVSYRIFR